MLQRIDAVYRAESQRVLATLIRLLGDFDLAEEALHDAFLAAVERWPIEGMPANPRAWLVSAGRFRAIDRQRRAAVFDDSRAAIIEQLGASVTEAVDLDDESLHDDQLRLIYTCCHPALPLDAQVALTLREVCGLMTEAIAHAYLTSAPTIAQRIVRAKAKIRAARIPYEIPSRLDLPQRLDAVLRVIYLVFNEGYAANEDDALSRTDLAVEAIRLGRGIVALQPDPEAVGLLALMLLHDARRAARSGERGQLVPLSEQKRSLWNRAQIAEGLAVLDRAVSMRRAGPYVLQAAIAAIHAQTADDSDPDWNEIVALYDMLYRLEPTPIVALNRAAAIAARDGPERGLALIDAIVADGELDDYRYVHAARADCLRRLGRAADAIAAYERALEFVMPAADREFLRGRIESLRPSPSANASLLLPPSS